MSEGENHVAAVVDAYTDRMCRASSFCHSKVVKAPSEGERGGWCAWM